MERFRYDSLLFLNRIFPNSRPDESDDRDPIALPENQSQNPYLDRSQPNCIKCFNLKVRATQMTAYQDEMHKKCQILRAENAKVRAQIVRITSKALQSGRIICYKRCDLCLTMVAAHDIRQHLCAGLMEIPCEYCSDATAFTSNIALQRHLKSGVHTDMKFYKCPKCTLGFRMRALLQIHESSDLAHSTDEPTNKCEYI